LKIDLVQGEVSSRIKALAIPASVGFFFNTMFNVVDTFFAGFISDVALASLSLTFPIYMLLLSVSLGIGTAVTTLLGNIIGSSVVTQTNNTSNAIKNNESVKLLFQAGLLCILMGLLMPIFAWFCFDEIYLYLGASGAYLEQARNYSMVLYFFSIAMIFVKFFNAILNANGDTKTYRNFLICSFLLNILLNPILIFEPFNLGVKGIAASTVFIQILGCIYLSRVCFRNSYFTLCNYKENLVPDFKVLYEILYNAVPAFINMFTVALGFFVCTYYVGLFGQDAVAAYGIATRIEQIFLLPGIGLNIAVLAMVSQNNGAGLINRVIESFRVAQKYALYLMLTGALVTIVFADQLTMVFTRNTKIIEISSYFLRIEALVFVAYSSMFICTSVLQGLKKPMFVVWLGVSRQVFFPFLALYFFIDILGYGLKSIWFSRFFITIIAAIFTNYYLRRELKLIKKTS